MERQQGKIKDEKERKSNKREGGKIIIDRKDKKCVDGATGDSGGNEI